MDTVTMAFCLADIINRCRDGHAPPPPLCNLSISFAPSPVGDLLSNRSKRRKVALRPYEAQSKWSKRR